MMTLIPRLCDEKSIKYEVKCKGTCKPFSKGRVILTHELKEKEEAFVKGLLSRVLKMNMSDCVELVLEQALMINPTDPCHEVKLVT